MPRGTIVVPSDLKPAFTFAPAAPGEQQTVLFDGSQSTAPANNPIVSYTWDFGDGVTASGRTAKHSFRSAGTYVVTLTVADALGRTAQTSQGVTVVPSASPNANFVFSPAEPSRTSIVIFNALTSTAAPGRPDRRLRWDFGDPANRTAGSGPQTTHRFTQAGTYNVTLTVTDDLGRTGSNTQGVTVQ